MPGAGSAEIAYRIEETWDTASNANWYQPGLNISVTDWSIDNQLSDNRQPNDPTPIGSSAGNFVGTIGLEWDLTDANWIGDLIPLNSLGALADKGGIAPTAEWYFSVDALDDSFAQFAQDVTFAATAISEATIQYNEGGTNTASATLQVGGGMSGNTPSSITRPADSDLYEHHGTTIAVGGRSQTGAQTASLSLNNLAVRDEGQGRLPYRMVTGAIQPRFETDAIFSERDQLKAAIDGSGASNTADSVADTLGEESGTFNHEAKDGDSIAIELTGLKPTSYSWSNLVNPDESLTEPATYHVTGVSFSVDNWVFGLAINSTNSPQAAGNDIDVTVDITNNSSSQATQPVVLDVNDVGTDSKSVTVSGNSTATETFSVDTTGVAADTYDAVVSTRAAEATTTVSVT